MDVISKEESSGRMFAGKGARMATNHEKAMGPQVSKWINKFLIRLKNQWLRDKGIVRKAEYAVTPAELSLIHI